MTPSVLPEPTASPDATASPEQSECRVDFSGTWYAVDPHRPFLIGRGGDLLLDDNPYLHRAFLEIRHVEGLWWLVNVGSRLSATVTDGGGGVQATLSVGGRLPLLFDRTSVMFTAGDSAYRLTIVTSAPIFRPRESAGAMAGETTRGTVVLTTSQRALIVALAEPLLRREDARVSEIPTSTRAAARLGWTQTRFNRKLDNVCDKLDAIGVSGVRGGPGGAAMQRRARVVEYAVATRLVGPEDLHLLDGPVHLAAGHGVRTKES